MTNKEKAKQIADGRQPCSEEFYNGIYEGVLLTLDGLDAHAASNRANVYKLIDEERDYQDLKWEIDPSNPHKHTPAEWIVFMEDYLLEAKHIITRQGNIRADYDAMGIIRKVAAMGVAAMEQNQTPRRRNELH